MSSTLLIVTMILELYLVTISTGIFIMTPFLVRHTGPYVLYEELSAVLSQSQVIHITP